MFRARLLAAGLLILSACPADTQEPEENADSGEPGTTTVDPTAPGTSGETGGGSESGEVVDPNAPKFYDDILPLFIQHCSSCHVDGGIGPYNLEDYETAKGLAEVIEISTAERGMPPYNADNSGECHTFLSARWLEQEQIDLIAAWVEGGAQEGDPNAPQPDRPELPTLQGNDVLEMHTPDPYQPIADESGELDDYQCFLGDFNLTDQPRYITGYEVVPGNESVTHHLVGFLVNLEASAPLGGTNGDLIQSLDDASPDQPGWDCFGAAGQGVGVEGTPVTWAPGGGAFNFPEGTGIRIDPGYALVMQMHYNLVNGDGSDHTVVRLAMQDEVEREAVNALDDRFLATLFSGSPVEIPGGEESFIWQWSNRLSSFNSRIGSWKSVELFGMLPHMHEIGNRMEVKIIDGPASNPTEQCGIYVDRWDFNWQTAYMYENPITVSPSAQLSVTCEWDSSDRTGATLPGLGTGNEMCLIGVYAAEGK